MMKRRMKREIEQEKERETRERKRRERERQERQERERERDEREDGIGEARVGSRRKIKMHAGSNMKVYKRLGCDIVSGDFFED